MKHPRFTLASIALPTFALTAISASAGPGVDPKSPITTKQEPASRWSFGFGYAPMIGVDVNYSGLGSWVSPNPVPPATGGIDRTYDDGFNRVDSTGNASNLTWNWGYENPAQYDPGTAAISMSVFSGIPTAQVKDDSDDWRHGVEFFSNYLMGNVPGLEINQRMPTWGWKMLIAYNKIDASNAIPLRSSVSMTTDTFALGRVIPPTAPYAGSFLGPGPLLSDLPVRTTSKMSGAASVSGLRDLDLDLFVLDAGPYLEWPISDRFLVRLEGGVSLGIASGTYNQTSMTTIPTVGAYSSAGRASNDTLLPGFFLGVQAAYQITESFDVYLGLRYRYLADFDMRAGTSKVEVDFSSAFVPQIGGVIRF